MKRIFSIGLTVAGLMILSCTNTKKASTQAGTSTTTKRKIACSEHKMEADKPHLDWIIEDNAVLESIKTLAKPSDYKVYSIDSAQLKTFFATAKSTNGKGTTVRTLIPLPAPFECKTYELSESGVMSDKLKQKYPDLVSLKGHDVETKKGDARIDFDGARLRGQVMWAGEVYLITSVKTASGIYYMVYAKKNTGEKKEGFESTGGDKKLPAYDR